MIPHLTLLIKPLMKLNLDYQLHISNTSKMQSLKRLAGRTSVLRQSPDQAYGNHFLWYLC
jgi:hypothetical protein